MKQNKTSDTNITSHAKVAIIGGGIFGVSLLYHLTKEGWKDIVLLEKGELTSGSTWHAAGQCPHFVGSYNLAKVHYHSTELYKKLEQETGQSTGWHGCGSLRLAYQQEDLDWFYYVKGILDNVGSPAKIISTQEITNIHPFIKLDGIIGALHTPEDGHTDPSSTTNAMAIGARNGGAKIYRHNRVIDIKSRPSGEWELITEKGNIICEHVVNAAGSYCPEVGHMVGLKNIPSINMIHHYLVTEEHPAIKKLKRELPVVRDPHSSCYLRQEGKGLLIGIYEKDAKCWALDGMDWKFNMELLEPELDRLEEHLKKGMDRIPQFRDVGIKKMICGPITHTPDGNFLAGPAPGLKNFWMFCAASVGIAQGGGAGKYMAQWMTYGDADINMLEFDPRRYLSWAHKDYAIAKSIDEYKRMYVTPLPNEGLDVGRPIKKTPIYKKLKDQGAIYIDAFGWERPKWFAETGMQEKYSYKRSNAFPYVQKECEAVYNSVGVLDLSTFTKCEISGEGSEAFLNRLCANRIPKKDGSIVLTHMLNAKGRIQSELTITRLPNNLFYVLSSTASEIRDFDWFNRHVSEREKVNIKNVTQDYGVLILVGPKSRTVLSQLTSQNLNNNDFPWLKGKEILINKIPVRALRVNYVGELGWELHHPMDQMVSLYDAIYEVGKKENIVNFGTYAVNSMRMEKAYRGWGSELTGEISLVEAGMDRFFNLKKKNNFFGAKALQEKVQSGVDIKLVYLDVDADNADAMGNEPIYHKNKIVGVTTSGSYGFRVKKSLAFGYVKSDLMNAGSELEIAIQGQRRKAKILDSAVYDQDNQKLKA
ncbi:MAG: FAD-dependent oxidoreductase [Pelagibacterales bacterium]|jgi:dimethylglycine dehydrogenase|nr:FAD-dependent oxidoreductase [Pelagibacterales bacterium]